jgi:hypothetical protein
MNQVVKHGRRFAAGSQIAEKGNIGRQKQDREHPPVMGIKTLIGNAANHQLQQSL